MKATTQLLLKAGADVGLRDSSGMTALQLAAEHGNSRVEKLLSQHAESALQGDSSDDGSQDSTHVSQSDRY